MKYLTNTERLNCIIYSSQRASLEKIKKNIEENHGIKVPVSELVRRALEVGIPIIEHDNSYVIELIQ